MRDDKTSWDVFISHASEDKSDFVQPLAKILTEFGVRVWYDEFTLRLGDSLSRSIDEGLSRSRFGLVVISPSFISKHWPEYELRGLVAREIGAGKVILPIWHNVDRATVLDFSPTLADKMALNSANLDLLHLAVEIIDVIRPDVFERIVRRIAFHKNLSSSVVPIALKEIRESPHRHAEFPEELIGRIRLIRSVLLEVYPSTMGAGSMDFEETLILPRRWLIGNGCAPFSPNTSLFIHHSHPIKGRRYFPPYY